MEKLTEYSSDINKCLQDIINIFKLQEITLVFNLLDQNNDLDNYELSDYAEPLTTRTVIRYQSFGNLPDPTRDYYDFKGWFLYFRKEESSSDLPVITWDNEVIDYSKVLLPGNRVNLYAKWELKTINIKLNPCGGSVYPEVIPCKLYDNLYDAMYRSVNAIKDPIKAKNEFDFWIDNLGERVKEDTILYPGVNILYAQYKIKYCTLKFDYAYKNITGVLSSPNSVFYKINNNTLSNLESGATVSLISCLTELEDNSEEYLNFIKDAHLSSRGRNFKGWSLLRNNPDTQFTVYIYDDTTVYASWDLYEYKIIYKYAQDSGNIKYTPLSVQTVKYNEVVSLIPYKTLFYKNPPTNFYWHHDETDHFTSSNKVFTDNDMVENLRCAGDADINFWPKDNPLDSDNFDGTITAIPESTISLKKYAINEPFYGLNFIMQFNNNEIRHPTLIEPSAFTADVDTVTCYYGRLTSTVEVQQIKEVTLEDVVFTLSDIYDTYEYGTTISLNNLYVVEHFSNGNSKRIHYKDYPDNFIVYPDVNTILKNSMRFYFGYRSITDQTIWPNKDGNKAFWDNTLIFKDITVNSGIESLMIEGPNKLIYNDGEHLNTDGLIVFLNMKNTKEIIQCDIEDVSFYSNDSRIETTTPLQPSDQTIIVKLDDPPSITASFEITVLEKQISEIDVINFTEIYSNTVDSINDIKQGGLSNLNLKIYYENSDTITQRSYSDVSSQLDFEVYSAEDLSNLYGEIVINVIYTPTEFNRRSEIFNKKITIKKRYPYTICEFKTNSTYSTFYINNIKNSQRISLECYDKGNTLKNVFFSDSMDKDLNYYFNKTKHVSNCTKFKITSLDTNIDNLQFDSNMNDIESGKAFINKYITNISGCVPSNTLYSSVLTSVTIGTSNISQINDFGFYNSNLKEITIPTNIEYIGQYAFAKCSGLSSIRFIDSCPSVYIGENAFGDNINNYTGIKLGPEKKARKLRLPTDKTFLSTYTADKTSIFNELLSDSRAYPFTLTC